MAKLIPNVAGYAYMGCFDDTRNRILDAALKRDNALTIESCGSYCNGGISPTRIYPYMGVEVGVQCFCGSNFNKTLQPVSDTACNQKCAGNPSQLCGAEAFIGVYTATISAVVGASPTFSMSTGVPTSTPVSPSKSTCSSKAFLESYLRFSATCRNSPTAIIATAVVAGVLPLALSGIVAYLLMRRKRKGVDAMPSVVSAPEKSAPTSEMEDTRQISRQYNVAELEVAYPAHELPGTTEGRGLFR